MNSYRKSSKLLWTCLSGVLFFLVLSSCSKKGVTADSNISSGTQFKINDTQYLPDGSDIVSIPVTFNKIDDIRYLTVQKSGAGFFKEQIAQTDLSLNYTFQYHIEENDPETFQLIFSLVFNDGTKSAQNIFITVVNKSGFFINKLEMIARVTGKSLPGEIFPSPNNTAGTWDVGGTDLGVIWEMTPGKYGLFFGDTFGADFKPNPQSPGPKGGNWRSNVLAFSENHDLDNGIKFTNMVTGTSTRAIEVVDGHQAGLPTSIPTAAVRANGVDYVHYFNTNPILAGVPFYYSGLYKSVDQGRNWTKVESVYFTSASKFALAGYWKKDGYVYMIGTPAYRDKPAYLARFKEDEIEDQSAYEYWNGSKKEWVKNDENEASVLIPGTVGELSFLYNQTLGKWIIVYGDIGHGFVSLRTADEIIGPWSNVMRLVSPDDYPMHYGPYLHPLSATGNALYFTLSMWEPYNVFLMKADVLNRD